MDFLGQCDCSFLEFSCWKVIADSAGVVRNNTVYTLSWAPPHTAGAPEELESIRSQHAGISLVRKTEYSPTRSCLSFHTCIHIHPTHPFLNPTIWPPLTWSSLSQSKTRGDRTMFRQTPGHNCPGCLILKAPGSQPRSGRRGSLQVI